MVERSGEITSWPVKETSPSLLPHAGRRLDCKSEHTERHE